MKLIITYALLSLLLSSSAPSESRARVFEVRVESKIEGCVCRHTVMVEAKNIYDARDKAQRLVQHKLTTRVTNTREIKR